MDSIKLTTSDLPEPDIVTDRLSQHKIPQPSEIEQVFGHAELNGPFYFICAMFFDPGLVRREGYLSIAHPIFAAIRNRYRYDAKYFPSRYLNTVNEQVELVLHDASEDFASEPGADIVYALVMLDTIRSLYGQSIYEGAELLTRKHTLIARPVIGKLEEMLRGHVEPRDIPSGLLSSELERHMGEFRTDNEQILRIQGLIKSRLERFIQNTGDREYLIRNFGVRSPRNSGITQIRDSVADSVSIIARKLKEGDVLDAGFVQQDVLQEYGTVINVAKWNEVVGFREGSFREPDPTLIVASREYPTLVAFNKDLYGYYLSLIYRDAQQRFIDSHDNFLAMPVTKTGDMTDNLATMDSSHDVKSLISLIKSFRKASQNTRAGVSMMRWLQEPQQGITYQGQKEIEEYARFRRSLQYMFEIGKDSLSTRYWERLRAAYRDTIYVPDIKKIEHIVKDKLPELEKMVYDPTYELKAA